MIIIIMIILIIIILLIIMTIRRKRIDSYLEWRCRPLLVYPLNPFRCHSR